MWQWTQRRRRRILREYREVRSRLRYRLTQPRASVLIDAFNSEQSERYDLFKRAKLNKPTLRKIVNQTLSQSVPPNVITTISGYTKIFIGEMIEKARTVQEQWADINDRAAFEEYETEEDTASIQNSQSTEQQKVGTDQEVTDSASVPLASNIKPEPSKEPTMKTEELQSFDGMASTPSSTPATLQSFSSPAVSPTTTTTTTGAQLAANGARTSRKKRPFKPPPNPHRGPLLPSHLREAFRRYRRDGEGGGVGFTGLSMNGLGVRGAYTWTVRGGGGRRLFR